MPISAVERRFINDQLGKRAQQDLVDMWDRAAFFSDIDFFQYVSEAFPDIALGYHQLAAEFSAAWFEYDFPELRAKTAAPLLAKALRKSAEWALGADGVKALDRMAGTMQRAIYDGDRQTTVLNAEINGMRWVRIAKADACAFCRLLASRAVDDYNLYRNPDAVVLNDQGEYELRVVGRSTNLELPDRRMIASGQITRDEALARRDQSLLTYQIGDRKGSPRGRRLRSDEGASKTKNGQSYGEKYHDDCRCTAKAIPSGQAAMDVLYQDEPEAAILIEQFNTEYIKASSAAEDGSLKSILSTWRQLGDDIA